MQRRAAFKILLLCRFNQEGGGGGACLELSGSSLKVFKTCENRFVDPHSSQQKNLLGSSPNFNFKKFLSNIFLLYSTVRAFILLCGFANTINARA